MIRAAAVLSKGRSHPWPKATRCPSSAATTKVFYRGDPGDRTRRPRRPSSPAPPIAIALAAVAALASASASPAACGEDPPRPAAPPRPHHIDAAFGALGKTLQARHERHMVQMAQLLHSLEALAEEAEKEARRTRTRHVCEEADAERAVDRRRTRAARRKAREAEEDVVHITDDEIAALSASPSTVWHIIDAFRGGRTCGREDVKRVCRAAAAILRREPSLVDLSARCGGDGADGNLASVTVVGDLHGHFEGSLTQILEMLGSGGGGEGPGSPWDGTGAVVFNGGELVPWPEFREGRSLGVSAGCLGWMTGRAGWMTSAKTTSRLNLTQARPGLVFTSCIKVLREFSGQTYDEGAELPFR